MPGQWLSHLRPHCLFDSCHPEGHCVPSITRSGSLPDDSLTVAPLWQLHSYRPSGRCRLVFRNVAQGLRTVVMRNGPLGEELRETGSSRRCSCRSSCNISAATLQQLAPPILCRAFWTRVGMVGRWSSMTPSILPWHPGAMMKSSASQKHGPIAIAVRAQLERQRNIPGSLDMAGVPKFGHTWTCFTRNSQCRKGCPQ